MWLSRVGGIAAVHSEWHCSLICVGLIVPQISQPFAVVSSLLPEGKVSHKSHQPRSWVWNMPASLILSGMSGSASWVLSIYHLISPKGNMHPERSLCSGSGLCVQPPGNGHPYGCKGDSYPSLSSIYCSAVTQQEKHYFAHIHHPQMALGFHHHFVSS